MTALTQSLERQMKAIAGEHLKIERIPDLNYILFKSQKGDEDRFILYYEVLTEFEILEVTKILAEVHSEFSKDTPPIRIASTSERNLNYSSEVSSQFVRVVIGLEASVLHKLLLLTSGSCFITDEHFDLLVALAKAKNEERFYPEDRPMSSRAYNYLKNLYILPGVTVQTVMPGGESPAMNVGSKGSISQTSRLMAFLANDFDNVTLRDYLLKDMTEVFATQKFLQDFSVLTTIKEILSVSDYKELVESMTASELSSLTCILDRTTLKGKFPETILRNRSKEMEKNVRPLTRFELDSILRYLSNDEQKSLSSLTFSEHVNDLLSFRDMSEKTPPIVYAALAEVFAVNGEKKTLEVARELKHFGFSRDRDIKIYEATVALILEAIKPENNDYPFSWTAQLSEHSWVLNSHLLGRELAKS